MSAGTASTTRAALATLAALACVASLGWVGADEAAAQAPPKLEPRGRVSLRNYALFDNEDDHSTDLLTADVDVMLPRVGGTGFSLLFDGEFRRDLSKHPELSDQEEEYAQVDPHAAAGKQEYLGRIERGLGTIRGGTLGDYVRSAYVEYAGLAGLLTLRGGRMQLTDLGQVWVDGGLVRADVIKGLFVGAFGGLAPDPLDYSFNTEHSSVGAFAGYDGRKVLLRVAFDQAMIGGETDRQFVFSSGHAGIADVLFLSYSLTVDLAGQKVTFPAGDWQGTDPQAEDLGPMVTMGMVNLLWWATPQLSVNLSGNTFRNVPFRVSRPAFWPTELDRDVLEGMLARRTDDRTLLPSYIQRLYLGDSTAFPAYYSLRLGPSLRFARSWYAYLTVDWRSRELDGEQARFASAGVRSSDIFGSRAYGRLEYTVRDNFLSDSDEVFFSLGRKLAGRVDLAGYLTLMDGRSMATTFGRDLLLQLREGGLDPRSAPERSDLRIDQRQRVWLVGLSLDIDITKRLYLLLDYEYTHESLLAEDAQDAEELVIHGLNARLTWRL